MFIGEAKIKGAIIFILNHLRIGMSIWALVLSSHSEAAHPRQEDPNMTEFTLRSKSFENEGEIPMIHTCQGQDQSPHLSWSHAPQTVKSFVLIMEDPDAPDPKAPLRTWVHWLLYNIPASTQELPAGMVNLPTGTGSGMNDFNRTRYGGPCPPIGRHRYYFKLFGLDTLLPDLGNPRKETLEAKMAGHIVVKAQLMGTYQKH